MSTAAVGDADALAKAVAQTSPDLAIIDVRMPPMMGPTEPQAAVVAACDKHRISGCSSSASTSALQPGTAR